MESDEFGLASVPLAKELINFSSQDTSNRIQEPQIIEPQLERILPEISETTPQMKSLINYGQYSSTDCGEQKLIRTGHNMSPVSKTSNYSPSQPTLNITKISPAVSQESGNNDKTINYIREDKPVLGKMRQRLKYLLTSLKCQLVCFILLYSNDIVTLFLVSCFDTFI